jgi:hypothetical protein
MKEEALHLMGGGEAQETTYKDSVRGERVNELNMTVETCSDKAAESTDVLVPLPNYMS